MQAAERSTALQSLQEAHQALKLRTAEQEGHRKKDLAKLQGAEEQVCGREQSTVELRGDLKTAEEALTRTKDEGTERAAEVGGLKGKLHRRPEDMLSLQETCGERGKAMAEQTCCMQQLQHEQEIGISQGQTQALGVEQLQGELDSCQQAQQPDLEQLRAKLQHLQQELDGCKEKNQADVSRLQQRECMAERQSWALESLRQQCQALKDEGLYYEEVVQKQERELCQQQEQLREAQEQLARAESQSQARASSLALYKEKYQACLARAGELEGQVQRLEEDLQDVSSQQAATGRGGQRATEQLPQALHTSEAELCRSRPHAQRCEQSIQGLREPLAAGHTTRLADETLVNVQTEFASYTATHSQGNASYERQAAVVETRQQKLGQAEGECARHSQRAEEYQSLAQDLTLELARVTEQKNSARKDLGTLERQVQSLRQDVAAEGSRVQQLERELRASRRLCAQQEQVVQSRDEQLRQARAQSQAGSGALREETRLLRRSLQGSQQQQQETARELAQQEQRLLLAQSSLQSAQEQLRQRQAELRALQERVSRSEDEAAQSRKRLAQRAAELSQWQQRLQGALQQGQQQQQRAAELELKLQRSQEQARALEQQLREQDATQQQLREELRRLQGREDAWQRQLQGAQGRVHVLQGEREELQRKATALARLQEELGAAQAGERQSSRQLAAAEATLQELTLKAASCHEHQRQALEQLREKTQEALALQAALVRTQHREAQLEAGTLAHKERLKRLNGELKKLQGFQQQSEQEARSCAEQLGQRSSQAQHWQRRHRASAQALAQRDEELLVCKVELASLQEKLHGATDERDRLQQELNSLRQTFVASSSEAEALRSALGAARSHSRRLQRESELVLANVSQWVKEQKQANEKLGHKIRAQIKHIARLTGEKEHLQEGLVQLQRENRRLQGAVAARRVEGERLQALHSSSSDEGAGPRPPWALLLGEE